MKVLIILTLWLLTDFGNVEGKPRRTSFYKDFEKANRESSNSIRHEDVDEKPSPKLTAEVLASLKGSLIGGAIGSYVGNNLGQLSVAPLNLGQLSWGWGGNSGTKGGETPICIITRKRRSLSDVDDFEDDDSDDIHSEDSKYIAKNPRNVVSYRSTPPISSAPSSFYPSYSAQSTSPSTATTGTATGTGTASAPAGPINCIIVSKSTK